VSPYLLRAGLVKIEAELLPGTPTRRWSALRASEAPKKISSLLAADRMAVGVASHLAPGSL
jgi:hypothetical protein